MKYEMILFFVDNREISRLARFNGATTFGRKLKVLDL